MNKLYSILRRINIRAILSFIICFVLSVCIYFESGLWTATLPILLFAVLNAVSEASETNSEKIRQIERRTQVLEGSNPPLL